MKKRVYTIALILLVSLFPACQAPAEPTETNAPPEEYVPAPVLVNLGFGYDDDGAREALEYAQSVVDDAGYQVTLEVTPFLLSNDPEKYLEYLKELLEGSNSVVIMRGSYYEQLANMVELGDIMEQARVLAPGFVSQMASFSSGDAFAYLVTSNYDPRNYNRPAVLVREDLYEAYGAEIETWEDYKAFLRFVKAREPLLTPGRIPSTEYIAMNALCTNAPLFDAILAQDGLYSTMLSRRGELAYNLYVDETGAVKAGEQLPQFPAMLQEILDLQASGLIKMSVPGAWPTNDAFASALISAGDYALNTASRQLAQQAGIDLFATDYRMCVLYPNALPYGYFEYPDYVAVMGANCNPGEFLRLLEKLGNDVAFYQSFMLGEEGVHYSILRNGTYVSNGVGGMFSYPCPYFLDSMVNLVGAKSIPCRAGIPLNYYEALMGIAYPAQDSYMQSAALKLREKESELEAYSGERKKAMVRLLTMLREEDETGAFQVMEEFRNDT